MALCLTAKIEDDEDSYVLYYFTARYKLITWIVLLTTSKYILLVNIVFLGGVSVRSLKRNTLKFNLSSASTP